LYTWVKRAAAGIIHDEEKNADHFFSAIRIIYTG
jgi:hypothetical protein